MFGTVARVTVQPGKEDEFVAITQEWTRARAEATGQIAEYLFKLEGQPGAFFAIGIFRDRETYRANAADSETDRWYRKMRSTLAADPEWHDGEIVTAAQLAGI
jgi:quinol monooxygenase YgiN